MRIGTMQVTVAFTAAASALLIRTAPLHSQMPGPLPAADHAGAPGLLLDDAFAQDTLDRTPQMIGGGLLGAVVPGSVVNGNVPGIVIAVAVPVLQLSTSISGERRAARPRTAPPEP